MVTLQEIQTMRQTVTQIQNSVITAKAQYNAAKDNIVKSFNDIIKTLSNEERADFFAQIQADDHIHINTSEENPTEISDVQDIDSMSKIIALIESIIAIYDKTADEMYQKIKDKVEEWNEILKDKENS